ncbi:MAG: DUF881 domain-containing protein [Tepidibacter sp.]|jgi:uncharacterized protein YlxW (UPF0749 family)|uniref:DUF881 domain-containing protein n=1 Tax=Tepidibacter sp. TaxID=2529387 RepID=UPI0025EC7503|nr:DUF881 domain-containing protein [Tepidibacter sp.]MCT4508532.1 DUF881 domain-containing protein [Tepidibacter sp.]
MGSVKIKQKSMIIANFIIGIIIAINIKSINGSQTFVTLKTIKEIENQIEIERVEVENLNKLILDKKSNIAKYELEIEDTGSIKNIIEKESYDAKVITGFEDVLGEGVIVRISDSKRDIEEWEDENDFVIHDENIIRVINNLKIAGAEAISINGERLTTFSEIKCAGPTITVNGNTYGQPFLIKAIGDKKFLKSAMEAPNSQINLKKYLYDIGFEAEEKDEIIIPKYSGKFKFEYIKEGD